MKESEFIGSSVQKEIDNRTGKDLTNYHRLVIISYLGSPESQFWKDAMAYIEQKVKQ
jgi:hypothetical protein